MAYLTVVFENLTTSCLLVCLFANTVFIISLQASQAGSFVLKALVPSSFKEGMLFLKPSPSVQITMYIFVLYLEIVFVLALNKCLRKC